MRFLCDAHISYKLANHLTAMGFETVYVNDILDKSETRDSDICRYADQNDLIVITKDADFRDSYFIKQTPKKIIKVNLGNIPNQELVRIFTENISTFEKLSSKPNFLLEIDKEGINLIEI